MKNKKIIWNIINLFNGLLLMLYIAKVLHWFTILNPLELYHFLMFAAIIYGVRSWYESKYDLDNLVKSNRITRILYYLGGGVFILAIMFKIMHWPGGALLYLLGGVTVFTSFIISFFLNTDLSFKQDPNILDDIS
jgi:hypothetical protein